MADLKKCYGLVPEEIAVVTGGLLNRKWKIQTAKDELLVNQYSSERFDRKGMERIEQCLQRQLMLWENGVPCPRLWQHKDGIVRWLDDKTAYMIMEFCPGKTERAEAVSVAQMHSLGNACAVMHKAFSRLPMPLGEGLPASGGYTLASLRESMAARLKACPRQAAPAYQSALLAVQTVLQQLEASFFARCPKGFAHEDFHAGNILFCDGGVSAIVDFDRNCHSYVWHDVGRAMLSFALEGEELNAEKVSAFQEGYSQHLPLTRHNVADALRLAWCIETPWWLWPKFFAECDETPRRFRDEMLWLTKHWFQLDAMVAGR